MTIYAYAHDDEPADEPEDDPDLIDLAAKADAILEEDGAAALSSPQG